MATCISLIETESDAVQWLRDDLSPDESTSQEDPHSDLGHAHAGRGPPPLPGVRGADAALGLDRSVVEGNQVAAVGALV